MRRLIGSRGELAWESINRPLVVFVATADAAWYACAGEAENAEDANSDPSFDLKVVTFAAASLSSYNFVADYNMPGFRRLLWGTDGKIWERHWRSHTISTLQASVIEIAMSSWLKSFDRLSGPVLYCNSL